MKPEEEKHGTEGSGSTNGHGTTNNSVQECLGPNSGGLELLVGHGGPEPVKNQAVTVDAGSGCNPVARDYRGHDFASHNPAEAAVETDDVQDHGRLVPVIRAQIGFDDSDVDPDV